MPETAFSATPTASSHSASATLVRTLFWLAVAIMAIRLLSMAVLPMSDTTEPRYAETARLMATSGDWITPWFEPGVPFWGKPPLSFWAQAGAIQLLGTHDLAVRLPSWIAMLGVLWLTAACARLYGGNQLAALSTLILASMALPFVSAGAVMTDPFLALGTTLSLVALAFAAQGHSSAWGWAFFGGLAIGLLAKGPLALVLVGLPAMLWAVWTGHWRKAWHILPWLRGSLLCALLVVPWYVAAELKTPGFLDYFLVGEHLRRFIDPGWAGDLYGSAHKETYGTIWLFLLWASLPWGPLGAWLLLRGLIQPTRRPALRHALQDPAVRLLLPAALAPAVFFTFSGNILWTYVLPGLPFLAILIAHAVLPALQHRLPRRSLLALSLLLPVAVSSAAIHLSTHPQKLNSAAALVRSAQTLSGGDLSAVYWLGDMPFSARYYSRGALRVLVEDEIDRIAEAHGPILIAVRERDLNRLAQRHGGRLAVVHRGGGRYALLRLTPES